MIPLCCQTDWIANICTLIAGGCSAFVAWLVWRQQKKLQREQIRFERSAQVARLKNVLCDIQQRSDLFLSDALSSLRLVDVRTREAIYREFSQRYNLLNNLRNELLREDRFATILATSKEYQDCKQDLKAMIQLQLDSWYNLSTIVMRVDPAKIQKAYADSYRRHNPDNKTDNPQAQYKVLNDILSLNPENPYMAGFTFAEFLGACQKVFHEKDNIFEILNKIVKQ